MSTAILASGGRRFVLAAPATFNHTLELELLGTKIMPAPGPTVFTNDD